MPVAVGRSRGASLLELLVAMTILLLIGAAVANALRLHVGINGRVASRVGAASQLREAAAPLHADLEAASPAAGDLLGATLSDTAVELRATIAHGHVCDVAADGTTLWVLLSSRQGHAVTSGDSIHVYAGRGRWRMAPIQGAARPAAVPAACGTSEPASHAVRLGLDAPTTAGLERGMPVRVTCRIRYSFYRGSDGGTHLGLREWSHTAGALAVIQPVAGPLDPHHSRFRYLDSAGGTMAPRAIGGPTVAAIGIALASRSIPGRAASRHDSVIVPLRNRP